MMAKPKFKLQQVRSLMHVDMCVDINGSRLLYTLTFSFPNREDHLNYGCK